MLNTCTVFGLIVRFLQNRYFLAILLYRKHNMFIQKKNSNPSQVIKQHEFIITNNKSMRFKIKICLDDSPYRDHTSAFTLEPKEKKLFCGLRFFWTRRQFSCRQRKSHICWLVGENCLVFLRGIRCGILCNVPCIWCITVFCGKIT